MTDEDDLLEEAQPGGGADGLEALVEDLPEGNAEEASDYEVGPSLPEVSGRPPPLPPRRIPPRFFVLGGIVVLVACVAAVVVSQLLFSDAPTVARPTAPETVPEAAAEVPGEPPPEAEEPTTVRIQLPEVVIGAEEDEDESSGREEAP